MIIKWHCRGCSISGEQEIVYDEIKPQIEKGMNLIEAAQTLVIHDCIYRNIGVKLNGRNMENERREDPNSVDK